MSTEFTAEGLEPKLLSLCQIAQRLGVHRSTIYRKLKKRGIKLPSGLLGPKWQQVILQVLNGEIVDEEILNSLSFQSHCN